VIVLDASALVELLLGTQTGHRVATRIADPSLGLHLPHLADVEVIQVLRRLVRARELDVRSASEALSNLTALDLERHSHDTLLPRVWALRDQLSAYDAVYVALAEALDAVLLTCDARLANAPGLTVKVELLTDSSESASH
jgi:predicted nucleic acid-binding protein